MVYIIIILLIVLPFIFYIVFGEKIKLKIRYYYLIEVFIVLLLTAVGHFYYYNTYDMNIFPDGEYIMMFFWVPIVGLLIIAIFDFLFHRKKKESRWSMKGYLILFIFLVVFFTWLLPLGQKYYYVKRLDLVEEIFAGRDTDRVSTDGDIMIGLVKSEYDPLIRPPFRSITYTNYFYIKNNGNTLYEGDIYLLLYDENNEPIDIKLLEDVEADPNDIRLLVENKNNTITDEWAESSFGTKQQVKTFEAVVGER